MVRVRRLAYTAFIMIVAIACWHTGLFAQKTVHVKGYTKKDGTVVKPYDRKAPGGGSATAPTPTPSTSAPAVAPAAVASQETAPVSAAGSQAQVAPGATAAGSLPVYIVTGAKATAIARG